MKTRIIVIVLLLLVLAVLLTRNDDRIAATLLNTINPIKQRYQQFTQSIEDKSHSYIFQKETIEKLNNENLILRKRLLEQIHYIEQIQNVYDVLPNLSKLPIQNISISETISYVKLNSFSQIILTKPKDLIENRIYGLIQGTVVAGVAILKNNQLYGYLTSDNKCRFSVFVGEKKASGIAIGDKRDSIIVKFIPKWNNIKIGDKVVTSGLDKIFFSNLPVGIVRKVEVQSAYTVAYIEPYNNVLHPRTFFVVNNPKATILENFDSNSTNLIMDCPKHCTDSNITDENSTHTLRAEYNETIPVISSIPSRVDQTQHDVIEPNIPTEEEKPKPIKKKKKKVIKKETTNKYKHHQSMDLF